MSRSIKFTIDGGKIGIGKYKYLLGLLGHKNLTERVELGGNTLLLMVQPEALTESDGPT